MAVPIICPKGFVRNFLCVDGFATTLKTPYCDLKIAKGAVNAIFFKNRESISAEAGEKHLLYPSLPSSSCLIVITALVIKTIGLITMPVASE